MKDVLITGAYGGMGRATALFLRDCGFRVFALDRSVGAAEEGIIPVLTDLTAPDSVYAALDTVRRYTDSLYAIIHFAGIYMLDSLVEMTDVDFDKILDVNLKAAFRINKTFLPLLLAGSRIIITTSELAPLDPLPFTGIYAVTKAALDKYAYSLRMELQLLDISVSVLRAGAVKTGMLGVSTEALDRFCEKTDLYSCNASRFRKIVNDVESRCVTPEKIARKVLSVLKKKHPSFAYSVNRNSLLLLLDCLPAALQFFVIRKILK